MSGTFTAHTSVAPYPGGLGARTRSRSCGGLGLQEGHPKQGLRGAGAGSVSGAGAAREGRRPEPARVSRRLGVWTPAREAPRSPGGGEAGMGVSALVQGDPLQEKTLGWSDPLR